MLVHLMFQWSHGCPIRKRLLKAVQSSAGSHAASAGKPVHWFKRKTKQRQNKTPETEKAKRKIWEGKNFLGNSKIWWEGSTFNNFSGNAKHPSTLLSTLLWLRDFGRQRRVVEQVARRLLRDAFGSPSERTVALAPPLTLALFVAWILGRASRPSGPSTSGSSCPCQNNRFSGMPISLECLDLSCFMLPMFHFNQTKCS